MLAPPHSLHARPSLLPLVMYFMAGSVLFGSYTTLQVGHHQR